MTIPVRVRRSELDSVASSYTMRLNRWNKTYIPDRVVVLDADTMLVRGGPDTVRFNACGAAHVERKVSRTYLVRENGVTYIRFEFL